MDVQTGRNLWFEFWGIRNLNYWDSSIFVITDIQFCRIHKNVRFNFLVCSIQMLILHTGLNICVQILPIAIYHNIATIFILWILKCILQRSRYLRQRFQWKFRLPRFFFDWFRSAITINNPKLAMMKIPYIRVVRSPNLLHKQYVSNA